MIRAALIFLLVGAGAASLAHAEEAASPGGQGPFAALALEPHPGAALPLDGALVDEAGQAISLRPLLAGKPVVLVFDYLGCKTICGLALANLAEAAASLPSPPRVLAISIDPRDTSAAAAAAHARYQPATDWHFLTGPEAAVRPIADAAGFHYRYDAATDQYIHSAGYIVVAADGVVSGYLPELSVSPAVTTGQLAAALATAAQGRSAAPLSRFLLLCFGGGPASGRFTTAIEAALILLNLAGMSAAIAIFARRLRRRGIERS